MSLNPFIAFLKTLSYLLRGRLHFPRNRIDEVITMEDGQEFVIFRHVVVDHRPDQPEKPGATFRVRFRFAHGSPKQNRRFSLFPIPFIVGLPGFRSKLWTINERSGVFQGIYEWDTVQDAENYTHSFPLKLMTKRSVPGSVFYETSPNKSKLHQ